MNFDPIVYFLKERVPFFPWGIIPVIIFFLGSIPGPFEFVLLYNLLWGVFFFRCLDQVARFEIYNADYLVENKKIDKRSGIILTLVFGFLFISSLLLMHSLLNVIAVFCTILMAIAFYYFLRNKDAQKYIQFIHYPLFFYLVLSY